MSHVRRFGSIVFTGVRRAVHSDRFLAGAVALVFTYLLFCDYLPPFRRVHLWSDISGYHLPLQAYAHDALKEGRIPLWDSTIYCGISFIGNVQAALLYPPNWLLYAATWRLLRLPFQALQIFTFLHLWMAFWLCYLWLRRKTGPLASALGSAVFAYSGFMMYETLHTGVISAMTWMPLGFWGVDEAVDRHDWKPLWKVAAASALAFLGGYTATWFPLCAVTAVYAVASRWNWRAALGTCAALGASVLLIAAELLPAMDAQSLMLPGPKYGTGAWGWRTVLLSYLVPNWFDFNPGHPAYYEPGCVYLYVGVAAIFAILWAVRRFEWRPYLQPAIGLAAALTLANPPAPLARVVERIPMLENSMWAFQFYAGAAPMVAMITALGVDAFLNAPGRAKGRAPRWMACAVTAALAAWPVRQLCFLDGQLPAHGGAVGSMLVTLGVFSAGLWVFRRSWGWERAVVGILILFCAGADYRVYGAARWFNAMDGEAASVGDIKEMRGLNAPAFRAITAHREYRLACDEAASPYPTDLRFWHLATPQGFDPFVPFPYHRVIERWVKFQSDRVFFVDPRNAEMLQGLGVRYVLTHEGVSNQPYLSKSPDFALVGAADSFYLVYEYRNAKPPFGWEDERNGTVRRLQWTPERREFEVQSGAGGRFRLVEQYYPGWQAKVDGRVVNIERWNGAFQAIAVPPGVHTVGFEFRPASFRVGAAISLSALIGLVVVAMADVGSRRRAERGKM